MPNLKNLIANLQSDYPHLSISIGSRTKFTPPNRLFYTKDTTPLELLHELGHYLLERHNYSSDIDLLRIESEAWEKAKILCGKYQVEWNEDYAENHLDTYRDWLHLTSLCKNCQLAGYQDSSLLYHCPLCGATWHSNIQPE